MRKYFKPPTNLVKEWPEVFDDLYMNTMPVAYLESLILEFDDGRVWEIDVKQQLDMDDPNKIAKKLLDTINEYKDEIKKVDFKFDVDLLKKEIKKRTDNLL